LPLAITIRPFQKPVILGLISVDLPNPYLKVTKWLWGLDPLGLRYTMNMIYDRIQKPIFIVENGLGAIDQPDENNYVEDNYRIDYLQKHLSAMADAININKVHVLAIPCGLQLI
jgi:beta-glucosidase/6-phospho-beta-glucosidase/beta-galactosidase